MKSVFLVLALSVWAGKLLAVNYYVSEMGSNTNDGKSEAKPFLTIQKAADLTVAGDTVFVMNGVYKSTLGPILNITRSGTAAGYIVYKALKGHTPRITASGNVWNAVSINGSYVLVDGFELEGNNANITYETAFKAYTDYMNGMVGPQANFNTNALTIGGPGKESKLPHHVTVRNCRVHDFPGGGINSIQADYTTIENNVVYNNAWYMMYGGSGISILTPYDSDKVTTYKNIVRNNICNTNKTTISWASQKRLSDGNGIIIDINQYPYGLKPGEGTPYVGRTLVENNVSVNNGGSGIHSYSADHVDIINNTAYHNGTVVGYPDIFSNACKDVNIINNIMYSRTGGDCNSKPRNASEVYNHNIYFNGKVGAQGPNDAIADPQFINLSTDYTLANFRVKPSSPAVDRGTNVAGLFSRTDLLGISRPQGAKPDIGAYEFREQAAIITALTEPVTAEMVTIYPNPAEDAVTIQWKSVAGSQVRVDILNSLGQSVTRHILSAVSDRINTRNLANGLYWLLVYRDDKLISTNKLLR